MSNKHLPISGCKFQFEIALEHNTLMNEHGEIDDQLMCHYNHVNIVITLMFH